VVDLALLWRGLSLLHRAGSNDAATLRRCQRRGENGMDMTRRRRRQLPLGPRRDLCPETRIDRVDLGRLELLYLSRPEIGADVLVEQLAISLQGLRADGLLLPARCADCDPLVEPIVDRHVAWRDMLTRVCLTKQRAELLTRFGLRCPRLEGIGELPAVDRIAQAIGVAALLDRSGAVTVASRSLPPSFLRWPQDRADPHRMGDRVDVVVDDVGVVLEVHCHHDDGPGHPAYGRGSEIS